MTHNARNSMQSSNTKEVHSSAIAQHSATDPTVPTSFNTKSSLSFPSRSFTFTHALSSAPQIDPVAVFRGMDEILQQVLTNDTSAQDPRIWDRFLCLSYLGILVKSVPDDFALSLSTEERAAHLQDLEVRLEKLKESNVPGNDGLPLGQVTPGPSPPAVHYSGDPTRPDSPASGSLIDFEQGVFSTDALAVVDGGEPAIAQTVLVPDQQYQESFAPPIVATPNLHPRVPFQARNASRVGASTAFGTYGSGTVSPVPPLAIPGYSVGRVMQPMPRMSNLYRTASPALVHSPQMPMRRGPMPPLPGLPGAAYYGQVPGMDLPPMSMYHRSLSTGPMFVRPHSAPTSYAGQRGPTPAFSPSPALMPRSSTVLPSMPMGPPSTLPLRMTPYNTGLSAFPPPFAMYRGVAPGSSGTGRHIPGPPVPLMPFVEDIYPPCSKVPIMPATFTTDTMFHVMTPENYAPRSMAIPPPNHQPAVSEKETGPMPRAASVSTSAMTSATKGSKRKRDGAEERDTGRIVLPRNQSTLQMRKDGSALRHSTLARNARQYELPQPDVSAGEWDIEAMYAPAS